MTTSKFVLVVNTNNDGATTASEIAPNVASNANTGGVGSADTIHSIASFLQTQVSGRGINIAYYDTAVSASTTGTFTGAPSADETITVNGVAFTAKSSGASGNQFNIGADVTTTAANLTAAINASTTAKIVGTVGATSLAGVVTFYSIVPGSVGLNIPISEALSNFTVADTTFSTGGTQAHSAFINSALLQTS